MLENKDVIIYFVKYYISMTSMDSKVLFKHSWMVYIMKWSKLEVGSKKIT